MKKTAFLFITLIALSFAPPGIKAQEATEKPAAAPAEIQPKKAEVVIPTKLAPVQEVTESKEDPKAKNITSDLQQNKPKLDISFGKLIWILIILIGAYLIIKLLTKVLEALAEEWSGQRLLIKSFLPIFRILCWSFAAYVVIEGVINPPFESLLAFGASAGLALGFASQDVLKNILGGILILIDNPFQVGDKIEADGHYGEVVNIGLRTVRIITSDDNLVSIPNGNIINHAVSNANAGEPNCQVVAEVYVPLGVDLGRVRILARESAVTSQYIFLDKPIAVVLKNEMQEGKSWIKVSIKAYVHDIRNEFSFSSEMTEQFLSSALKEGFFDNELKLTMPNPS